MQRKPLPLTLALSSAILSVCALAACSSPAPPASGDTPQAASSAAAPGATAAAPVNPCAPHAATTAAQPKGAANPCAPGSGGH